MSETDRIPQGFRSELIIMKILIPILLVFILALLMIFVYHRICLRREEKKYLPAGKMVTVNGHRMHVYSEGKGADTLVFLSGSGTACPLLDFKALYSKLSENYRIAVVEKAGYGFSRPFKVSRDIDTILEETRSALQAAGEKGPFVLFPHSLSGIEAIYWAQKYPEEIKAIIGLDAAVPEVYLQLGEKTLSDALVLMKALAVFSRIGVLRLIPAIYKSDPAMGGTLLSDPEKAMYRAVVRRSFMTQNMIDEGKTVFANAKTVNALEVPFNTPMFFFISDGKEVKIEGWQTLLTDYVKRVKNGHFIILNCGHYVHGHQADCIAEESHKFIESLKRL